MCSPINTPVIKPQTKNTEPLQQQSAIIASLFLSTEGSITQFLELLFQETIKAKKLDSSRVCHNLPKLSNSCCAIKNSDLYRHSVLYGANTRTNYLFAEVTADINTLCPDVLHELTNTNLPLGKIWRNLRTEHYKEIWESGIKPAPQLSEYFNTAQDEPFYYRFSVLYSQNRAVMTIYEWLPHRHLESFST